MRRALAAWLISAIALAGCGNTSAGSDATDSREREESAVATPTPSDEPTQSAQPSEQPTESDDDAIEIEIEGNRITPNGQLVKVAAGETVTLEIDSDRSGSLHVHSSPEQELSFGKGETTLDLTIERPGVVDVEEHEAGVVVLQLQVS